MSDDDRTEIIVAAAALVVSFVAFAATLMQCLQQYYSSARGYSQCSEKVIGKWATTKSRRFSFEELRFEVQFDAPVIFVCPPTNKNKPVPYADMYKLDGTDESFRDTWTTSDMKERKDYKEMSLKERIHTSDNERASWTLLLSAVQCMERYSGEWHREQFKGTGPPRNDMFATHNLPREPPSLEESHTLVVALQRKRKSWDTMPPAITRPYATTTMCHLVEMMAAMGIYWKEFNRTTDRYRAEGNGFMVLGERVSDLGLMFNFQMNGRWRFERNRVIPVDEIKELCFGWVPTIFRSSQDKSRLEVPIDLMDLSSLQMGTKSEIAEILMMIGCNNNTVTMFQGEKSRTSHLFPISFEILGMVSQTFHIKDSFFTFIPNPTPDRWDSRSVSLVKMMESLRDQFETSTPDVERNQGIIRLLQGHMNEVLAHGKDEPVEKLLRFRALHAALEDADEILTGRAKSARASTAHNPERLEGPDVNAKEPDITKRAMRRLTTMVGFQSPSPGSKATESNTSARKKPTVKEPPPDLSHENPAQRQRREQVQYVLRYHIQAVLQLLNGRENSSGDQTLAVSQSLGRPPRSRSSSYAYDTPTMEQVDAAGPDDREKELMKLYYENVRKQATPGVHQAPGHPARLQTTFPQVQKHDGEGSPESPVSPTQVSRPSGAPPPSQSSHVVQGAGPSQAAATSKEDSNRQSEQTQEKPSQKALADKAVSHDDIWCTLVFRMICWLMLHDFNKLDVQVPKSELLGSRMPVYVA